MYENRYNLTTKPFNLAPSVQSFFGAESIQQALGQSRICIEREAGPVIVTGSPGTGKSLLLAILETQYSATHRVVRLQCARLVERTDLLQTILFELGLQFRDMSEGELRLTLIDFLKTDTSQGLVLLVDEAHSLSTGLLDELRLITNFVRDGQQRVSLVMCGSPSLEDHLIDTRSESFNQRISARCYLAPLQQQETKEYILTHVERSGGNGEELFTDQALNSVHEFSEGCPRIINQICDQSLMIAAHVNSDRVSADIVRDAWNQVQSIPGATPTCVPSATVCTDEDTLRAAPDSGQGSDLVIEFGHLDSDDEPTVNDGLSENAPEQDFVTLQVESSTDGPGFQMDFTSNEESILFGGPVDSTQHVVSDLPDHHSTEPTTDEENVDRQRVFENPFEETFTEEERIESSYYPAVAEHNISSLTLKPDQLNFLDDVPATDQLPIATDGAVDDSHPGHDVPPQQDLPEQVETEELKISDQSLAQLDSLEADVIQIQAQIHTQVAAPDSPGTDIQPPSVPFVTEAVSAEPAQVPAPPTSEVDYQQTQPESVAIPNIETIASQIADQSFTTTTEDNILAQTENPTELDRETNVPPTPPVADDDRDMMVVEVKNDVSQPAYTVNNASPQPSVTASTGAAKRMNYEELFQQLRNKGK